MKKINVMYGKVKNPYGKGASFLPLIILELYLWLGYILYVVGPINFPFRHDIRTFLFILFCNICLSLGYTLVILKRQSTFVCAYIGCNHLYKYLLIIGIVLYIPTCYYRTGYPYPPFINGILDPGSTYFETIDLIEGRNPLFNLIGMFYIVNFCIVVLTYYYWEKLKKGEKTIGLILAFGYVLIELCSGKNLGITIYCVSIIVCYFAKLFGKQFKDKRSAATFFVYTIILMFVIMGLFVYNLKSRTRYSVEIETNIENAQNTDSLETGNDTKIDEDILETYYNLKAENMPPTDENLLERAKEYQKQEAIQPDYYLYPESLSYVDTENWLYTKLPDNLKFPYVFLTGYLSQGYHGLSIALYQDFDCSFGMGHLKTVDYYLDKLFGISFYDRTYEAKVTNTGYPLGLRWGTVYMQFASDFTFPGTVLLMSFMGGLLAILWQEVGIGKNMVSVVLFSFYCIQFLMFTSWWYAGLTGGYFITFYLPFFIWGLTYLIAKKNYNKL